jgi:IS5 family transposase
LLTALYTVRSERVEETFGWIKAVGGLRRTRYRGHAPVRMHAYLVAAAYNLVRIANLSQAPARKPSRQTCTPPASRSDQAPCP